MSQNPVVDKIFKTIEELLNENPGPMVASAVLYALGLAACWLGIDQQEEAKEFQAKWNEIKDRLQNMADRSEFMSQRKFIDDSIAQVLHPEQHEHARSLRAKSSLADHEEEFLGYLEVGE